MHNIIGLVNNKAYKIKYINTLYNP